LTSMKLTTLLVTLVGVVTNCQAFNGPIPTGLRSVGVGPSTTNLLTISNNRGFVNNIRNGYSSRIVAPTLSEKQSSEASDSKSNSKTFLQGKSARAVKAALALGVLVKAFTLNPLILRPNLSQCFIASFLATATALKRIEDCYSYGYGASLLAIGLLGGRDLMWGVTGKIAEAAGSSGAVPVMTPGARLVSAGCALHALAYIAYGIRMLFFIQIRNTSESYVNSDRFKRFADSEKKIALGRRLSVWWSTALLLGGLYALPLNLHLGQALECIQVVVPEVAKKKAKDAVVNNGGQVVLKEGFQLWRSIGAGAASLMALVALGVQAIADDQKLKHKEALYAEQKKAGAPPAAPWRERQLQYEAAAAAPAPVSGFCAPRAGCTPATPYYGEGYVGEPGAAPFCTSGLYSKWRHPNYAAEFVFQTMVALAALPALTSWHGALLAAAGPTVFASIIRAATTLLEKRQRDAYGGTRPYEAWVRATRRFLLY